MYLNPLFYFHYFKIQWSLWPISDAALILLFSAFLQHRSVYSWEGWWIKNRLLGYNKMSLQCWNTIYESVVIQQPNSAITRIKHLPLVWPKIHWEASDRLAIMKTAMHLQTWIINQAIAILSQEYEKEKTSFDYF